MSELLEFSSWPAPRRIILGRPVHFSNPPDADLDAFAAARLLPGVTVVEVSGTGETFTLAPDPQHAEIPGQLRAKRKPTVLEGTGTVDGSAPDRQRWLVSSVR